MDEEALSLATQVDREASTEEIVRQVSKLLMAYPDYGKSDHVNQAYVEQAVEILSQYPHWVFDPMRRQAIEICPHRPSISVLKQIASDIAALPYVAVAEKRKHSEADVALNKDPDTERRVSKAKDILSKAGYTPEHTEAVHANRMAKTRDDLRRAEKMLDERPAPRDTEKNISKARDNSRLVALARLDRIASQQKPATKSP